MALDGKTKLAGLIGTAAAVVALVMVPNHEGIRYTPYDDPVGIRTVCAGITRNVEERRYTKEECDNLLADELYRHADGAMKCLTKPTTAGQRVAYTSLAYNIGINAFCGSSVVRYHNAGDYRRACAAITMWDKGMVGGGLTVLPGLVIRRADERKQCERGLP